MSSSKRRLASGLTLLAIVASIGIAAPGRAGQSEEQRGRLCAAAVEMSVLSDALSGAGYLGKAADADAALAVRQDGDRLRIQNQALGVDLSPAYLPDSKNEACKLPLNSEKLAAIATIPMAYVASFAQVMRYRIAHLPLDGADLTQRSTYAIMATYGPYVLVMLWTPGPVGTLGCEGLEYYRRDPRTNQVLPFDGCVEGHRRTLSGLKQLPPR